MKKISEIDAKKELEKGYGKAKELLNNDEKMEEFLQKLEKKLNVIPVAGGVLSQVPVMVSLIRNYWKKEYNEIPLGTIIAIISALIYVLNPFDLVPDTLPGGLGHVDDAAVVAFCIKMVGSDIEDYQKWRTENNKMLDV